MPLKRKQILVNSLLGIIAFYLFSLYFALTFHKSALVTLSPAGKYSDFLTVIAGNEMLLYLIIPFEYVIKALTFILAQIGKFSDIILAHTSIMKAFVKAGILLFVPYFLLFVIVLMSSDRVKSHRILLLSITGSIIINITLFYTLIQISAGNMTSKVPLEQLSAYSIFNMFAFIILYSIITRLIDGKEVEKN